MTYKQIEASREVRLWIGQIVLPAGLVVAAVVANPEFRAYARAKWQDIKRKFQNKHKIVVVE